MSTATPTLAYASLPAKWGVTSDRQPTRLRIVIPPVPSWRHLNPFYLGGLVPLALAFWMLIISFTAHALAQMIFPIVLYSLAAIGVLGLAIYRLQTRKIIDITGNALAITRVNSIVRPRTIVWTRDRIGEVRLNPNNGKMLVRIIGHDLPEFYISPNRRVAEWVVQAVQNAFAHDEFEAMSTPDESDFSMSVPNPLKLQRTLMFGMASVVVGCALLFFAQTRIAGAVAIYVSALTVIVAAGITHGSQDRDFYF